MSSVVIGSTSGGLLLKDICAHRFPTDPGTKLKQFEN